MRALRWLGIFLLISATLPGIALAQSWTRTKNNPPDNIGVALLLHDGRVFAKSEINNAGNWYILTPDNNGSYINGTWTKAASLPSGYAPLYTGTAVLPDGRVLVEGGEYNNGQAVWTTLGAIYDPKTNTWTKVNPPSGWSRIGDAQTVVLPNGTLMLANCCDGPPYLSALFNAQNLTWTPTGTGKFDVYDEEGFTLLPNGKVLAVDAYVFINDPNGTNSELYDPSTGSWSSAGSTIQQLWDQCTQSFEEGPDVLLPNGTVFATGARGCGPGHTAIYNTANGTWTAGPDFQNNDDISDGPGAAEINGKALVMAAPGIFGPGPSFYEWDGTSLAKITGPPNVGGDPSYYGHFLELPTGQLLFTAFSTDVEVFTPAGSANAAWKPVITGGNAVKLVNINRGSTYTLQGKQFNGLTQGAFYGDDAQMATNYPIVAIRNLASGHIVFAPSHDYSTMAVATGNATVSTKFDVPSNAETGASQLFVIANGIRSNPVSVTVQ